MGGESVPWPVTFIVGVIATALLGMLLEAVFDHEENSRISVGVQQCVLEGRTYGCIDETVWYLDAHECRCDVGDGRIVRFGR